MDHYALRTAATALLFSDEIVDDVLTVVFAHYARALLASEPATPTRSDAALIAKLREFIARGSNGAAGYRSALIGLAALLDEHEKGTER